MPPSIGVTPDHRQGAVDHQVVHSSVDASCGAADLGARREAKLGQPRIISSIVNLGQGQMERP